jgi:hypothetical protein
MLPMEAHIEHVLRVLEHYDSLIRRLQDEVALGLHLTYRLSDRGGWEFSPELMKLLTRWPLKIVVAIEVEAGVSPNY